MTFYLSSLAHLLKEIFRKSDLPLRSHVTFCLCLSARKLLIFVICVQNIWKSHFSNKEIKHWLFGLVYSLGVYFLGQNSWLIVGNEIKQQKQ